LRRQFRQGFENRSPVDDSIVSVVEEASAADVDRAVRAAKAALAGPWGAMTIKDRCNLLNAVANGIAKRLDEFLRAEMADTGKPDVLARNYDIPRGAANFRIFTDLIRMAPEQAFRQDTSDGAGAFNYTVRKPKGVVAVISPWNLPLLLMTWKVAPALACGNTVVAKPSEETPSTATLLGDVMRHAGVPAGVYNVVHGFGPNSASEFLARHPLVDAITFTGETQTGEAIMNAASAGMRDISSELGGKNAALVFADCDLDKAVAGTVRSSFTNSGQICLCTERVYVERSIFDSFVERLKVATEKLTLSHPDQTDGDLGPLISKGHRQKVLSYYEMAKAEGARIVVGGGVPDVDPKLADGAWIEPTIWTELPETSRVIREEIFGPCCHVRPFNSEEEAVRLANDSPYGLASVICSAYVHRPALSNCYGNRNRGR
jgi:aminomuconate-semialdehyde/2-hydroxymuconate-6-semialdehyde dehydrogenase